MELAKLIARCLLPLELPAEELNFLAKTTIQAMEQRIGELTGSLESAKLQAEKFEVKYAMDYLEFKRVYLQNPKGKEEDYVTWCFWEKVRANREILLDQYQELITSRSN
jgi:hypothetical protein